MRGGDPTRQITQRLLRHIEYRYSSLFHCVTPASCYTLNLFQPDVSISESGLVAYEAAFVGGGEGLFVEQTLLLATGDVVNGKTIASVNPPQVNDAGTIVAMVTFTDNTEAIVTVPEPTAMAPLAVAALALARRRCRMLSK